MAYGDTVRIENIKEVTMSKKTNDRNHTGSITKEPWYNLYIESKTGYGISLEFTTKEDWSKFINAINELDENTKESE